ncbi:CCR4-NOT transcriptional complex subunit [Clarias magur]|uniref:CCR4-NOT transcriptional complex subunit n=1 Tax=Clarias magur TaxID=1594786 RepID=A0A8J4TNU6_CLAMG|nr:CCR4-NOT transcriptional complex subunit [Clarias magur]
MKDKVHAKSFSHLQPVRRSSTANTRRELRSGFPQKRDQRPCPQNICFLQPAGLAGSRPGGRLTSPQAPWPSPSSGPSSHSGSFACISRGGEEDSAETLWTPCACSAEAGVLCRVSSFLTLAFALR